MEEINWERMIRHIKDGKCMLLIGLEAVTMRSNERKPVHHAAFNMIKEDHDFYLYEGEELLYFNKNQNSIRTAYGEIANFYKNQEIPNIFHQLAEIPFYFILNASPDNFLKRVFENKKKTTGFTYYSDYYEIEKSQKDKPIPQGSGNNPILYHIFGTVENHNTLLFTHDDLFRFLFSIIGDYKMPNGIKANFQNATFFIFLGFKFEKWYSKLLLRLFDMHNDGIKKSAMGLHQHTDNGETKKFFKEHFNVEFIESQIPEFVAELHRRCNEKNLLRNFDIVQKTCKDKLIGMINETEIADFFQKIDTLNISSPEINTLRKEYVMGLYKADIYDRFKTLVNGLNDLPNEC
jgi:hypothetical protein